MDEEPTPPGGATCDPRIAAVFDEMKPYFVVAGAVSLLGVPTETIVPIVRRLRGRTGVSLGPGLVTLVHGLLGVAMVRHYRRHPARWGRLKDQPVPRWLVAVPLYLLLSPVVAARWDRIVVLPYRSPLWGGLLSPIGLLQVALLGITLRRAAHVGRAADPSAA